MDRNADCNADYEILAPEDMEREARYVASFIKQRQICVVPGRLDGLPVVVLGAWRQTGERFDILPVAILLDERLARHLRGPRGEPLLDRDGRPVAEEPPTGLYL